MSTLVVVSGASKGFGRALALAWVLQTRSPLHVRLVGRDEVGLQETKRVLEEKAVGGRSLVVETLMLDLGEVGALTTVASAMFNLPTSAPEGSIFKVVFYNNAGTLGPLAGVGCYSGDMLKELTAAINLNVTSSCFLTADLLQRCQEDGEYTRAGVKKVAIVNVSSLAAVQPFESWGIYCAGKAAREMFHRCLSQECAKRLPSLPNVRVLNYAPGPLDTNMQQEIREGPAVDKDTQEFYRGLKEKNQLVSPAESAAKVTKILLFEKYDNGDHIDFYDKAPEYPETSSCCSCTTCTCGVDCSCGPGVPQCADCATKK